MSSQDVYHLDKKEIKQVYQLLAECFQKDDLYCAVFPDAQRRKFFLQHFFKYYIDMLSSTCFFVADSAACNALMVVYDSRKETRWHVFALAWLNIKMLVLLIRMHSLQEIRRLMDCWDMFTSRWVNEFVHDDYLHMDLLCTKSNMRGHGLGGTLMEYLMKMGKKRNCDITMETHHSDNLHLYEKKGFRLMSTMTREAYGLVQYNLLYRGERGSL